jgi:hypothetical protein
MARYSGALSAMTWLNRAGAERGSVWGGESLGIQRVSVEGRGRVLDSAALTDADLKAIAGAGAAH